MRALFDRVHLHIDATGRLTGVKASEPEHRAEVAEFKQALDELAVKYDLPRYR